MNTKRLNNLKDIKAKDVKEANRILYNSIGSRYEEIDGRREEQNFNWVKEKIDSLIEGRVKIHNKLKLLDIGCGKGFVFRLLRDLPFEFYGVDISDKILKGINIKEAKLICSDSDNIPFKENYFDIIICFSTLHHLYSLDNTFIEIHRVLKKGGILFTDHDITSSFMSRFSLLVNLYRKLSKKAERFKKATTLNGSIYEIAEYASNGIKDSIIPDLLTKIGFTNLQINYHWLGLNKSIDWILKFIRPSGIFPKGLAPLLRIVAVK